MLRGNFHAESRREGVYISVLGMMAHLSDVDDSKCVARHEAVAER